MPKIMESRNGGIPALVARQLKRFDNAGQVTKTQSNLYFCQLTVSIFRLGAMYDPWLAVFLYFLRRRYYVRLLQ